jgi:uncharacterized protein YecT (DUF1311 family)
MPKKLSEVDAHSALIKLRSSYGKCLDDAAGVVPVSRDCMAVEYKYQDKRLNAVYKKLMSLGTKDEQATLRNEERRWIAYRDSTCNAQEPQLAPEGCEVEATADRATELEARLRSK